MSCDTCASGRFTNPGSTACTLSAISASLATTGPACSSAPPSTSIPSLAYEKGATAFAMEPPVHQCVPEGRLHDHSYPYLSYFPEGGNWPLRPFAANGSMTNAACAPVYFHTDPGSHPGLLQRRTLPGTAPTSSELFWDG